MVSAEHVRSLGDATKEFERDYLIRTLAKFDGKRLKAAESLGISRKNLWEKLKMHGLSEPDDHETIAAGA